MSELIEVRRKAFEAWAAISGLSVTRSTVDMMFGSGARVSAGEYFQPTELAWRSWNAALDSVVIELPPVELLTGDDGVDDEVMCPQRVIKAIHAAGARTK